MAGRKKGSKNKSFIEKITELEAALGQKKAAEKLGVTPRTLSNYKTGKTKPKPEKKQQLNKVYRSNKKHITEEKTERYKKKVETKKEVRRQQLRKNPKLMSVQKWVNQEFDEPYIQQNIMKDAPPFIAPLDGRGQFTNGLDPLGLPKGTKYVILYGLYEALLFSSGKWFAPNENKPIQERMDYLTSRFPITLRKEMDLEAALDYLEGKFMATSKQTGKRKMNPVKFVGYQLP